MSANHIVVLLAVDFAGLPCVKVYWVSIRGYYEMFGRIYFAYDDKSARNCLGIKVKVEPVRLVCWALD
jgi:hypothetical protein